MSTTAGSNHDPAVLLALCVTAFMAALNFTATSPFYPEMADDLESTVPLIGQVITVMILISAVLGLAIGPLADRYGFRRPLTIGLVAVGVNLIGTGFSPSIPFLFAFSIVGGLADAIVFGLAFAVAGTYFHGAARVKAIGWTAGSLSIAPIMGVPALTFIGDLVGWRSALATGGALAIGSACYVWTSLPGDRLRSSLPPLQVRDMIDPYRPLLKHMPTMTTYSVNLLRGITWFSMILYLGAFLEDQLDLETREIGFVYMLSGIGYAVGSFSTRPSLPGSLMRIAAITSLFCAGAVAVILLSANLWTVLLILPVSSFMASRCGIALATRLSGLHQSGTGTVMVLSGSVLNLSAAMSALVGGLLIGFGGYRALGIGIPIFSVIAAWIAFRTDRAGGTA